MSSEPTSSAAAAAVDTADDSLRRSKRKKFCLDVVAAAHGNNQKKSRRDPHGQESEDDDFEEIGELGELKVFTGDDDMDDDLEDDPDDSIMRRRSRRSTAVFQGYQQDTMVNYVEMTGPYACHKCPSRYVSKSSLANHSKMHMGERRKFACELCDFSSSTLKSLSHHHNVHKNFGVLSAPTSPADAAIVATVATPISPGAEAPPLLNLSTDSVSSLNNSGAAPQLELEEPFALEGEDDPDETPPPILEREDGGPPVLLREITPEPEREMIDEEEEEELYEPVRKSGRSLKPTQKKLEQKRTYQKKTLRPLRLDTPLSGSGSLPTSVSTSSASSVTPPEKPSPPPVLVKAPKMMQLPQKNKLVNLKLQKKMKRRQRCSNCPFTTSTVSRLKRHSAGHLMTEGYICPVENCQYICRKAGFLPKHFILHNGTLPWPPKYVKKLGKKIVEMPEKNEHLGEKPKKGTVPKKSMVRKKKSTVKRKMEKVQEEPTKKVVEKKKENRVELMGQAQIKSHKKVQIDDVIYKQCNIGECDFQTTSLTQLVVHKTKTHRAKSIFHQHPFMCFTCGLRTKTYASLRVHKLTNHTMTSRRFHRTYYLKEIVGDKFFIKHFTGIEVNVDREVEKKVMKEDEEDASGDESFESTPPTDITPTVDFAAVSSDVTTNGDQPKIFCCSVCPYKAPTTSRVVRHFAKHFTKDTYKCGYCSWSSRNKEVIVAHEKLHTSSTVVQNGEGKSDEQEVMVPMEEVSALRLKSTEPAPLVPEASEAPEAPVVGVSTEPPREISPIEKSLQKWCLAEKIHRPELDDQFTRKMMDGIKGFQCSDCPYTSKYRGDMRSHKKRHDIEQMYRCVQCTYTTNRPVSLKDHLKQHLTVNNSTAISRKVVVNQGITIGMRRGTGTDRVYCCNKCPYTTLTIGCLWRHHRNHRTTAKINICSNCSYSSIDQRKMEEHTIIHLALGTNEPMPFVKRVDQKGNPVSSLTDLTSINDRKATKKKLEAAEKEKDKGKEKDTDKAPETPPKLTRAAKVPKVQTPKSQTPKSEPRPERPRRRAVSKERSPDLDYSLPGPSQPTRQLSERATRNRINYSLLSKIGSGKPTPSASSAHLEKMTEQDEQPEEPIEVSHYRIRAYLKETFGTSIANKCPECPYKTSDDDIMASHRAFHLPTVPPRPFVCTDCSFNTITPTALLQHLKLHSEGIYIDPVIKRVQKTHHRKGDTIPAGVKGFYCKNCSFKTANLRNFKDHVETHRRQLANRIKISLKRQPPKQEYQRPKHKHQFVAKNAKYCKKCTFKCVSQSNYIEHLDRHGWNQLYTCYICDYSDNNKSVVDFHQLTHHVVRDQTLHGINQASQFRLDGGKISKPEIDKPKPTPEEFVQKSRTLLKCASCEYFCHVSSELAFHMSVNHLDEPDARQTISYLHMGLVPPNASIATVL